MSMFRDGKRWGVLSMLVLAVCWSAVSSQAMVEVAPGSEQRCQLGDRAELMVPGGFVFLDGSETRQFMEANGNIPTHRELGTVVHADTGWFVVFEFDDVGYIKDEDSDLDSKALLKSIKKGTEYSNKERKKLGHAPMTITGWHTKPRYNAETKNLEWCVAAESEGQPVLNHNTRILGRKGVMEVTLVCGPEELDGAIADLRSMLDGYKYLPGQKYSEWRSGDKVAQYGLGALVVGGAGAVAYKSGLLGKLLKPLLIGLAVVGGGIATVWKKILGKD